MPAGKGAKARRFSWRGRKPDAAATDHHCKGCRRIVWALRAWSGDTNLGPATTIQLLNDPILKESLRFGSQR
jgi:hypothetical protein